MSQHRSYAERHAAIRAATRLHITRRLAGLSREPLT